MVQKIKIEKHGIVIRTFLSWWKIFWAFCLWNEKMHKEAWARINKSREMVWRNNEFVFAKTGM